MKAPRLRIRGLKGIEGRIWYPEEWVEYTPAMRADLLSDWINELYRARLEAVDQIGTPAEQRAAGYIIIEAEDKKLGFPPRRHNSGKKHDQKNSGPV